VNQIFKDLGQMVYEQGEVIDSIEAHVEKTEIFVSEGTGQLHQASQYQVSFLVEFFAQFILT
jgi:syntaxin 7